MPGEEKKELGQSRAKDSTDQQAQGEGKIQDLAPNDRDAGDVRGGVLPPSDIRGAYILPPEE